MSSNFGSSEPPSWTLMHVTAALALSGPLTCCGLASVHARHQAGLRPSVYPFTPRQFLYNLSTRQVKACDKYSADRSSAQNREQRTARLRKRGGIARKKARDVGLKCKSSR